MKMEKKNLEIGCQDLMKYNTKMFFAELFFTTGSFLFLGINAIIWCYFFGLLQ